MAKKARKLKCFLTPEAEQDLKVIWVWNANNHSPDHADRYIQFLAGAVRKIRPGFGRPVEGRPDLHYQRFDAVPADTGTSLFTS